LILMAEAEGMTRLFNLDFQLLQDSALMIVAIFFLWLIASNKLFNPVRKMLKDRQDRIKADIEDARKDKEDASKLREEYEERLKDIDKEAEQILAEARAKALKNEEQIVSRAKEEAALIIDRANKEAELEKEKVADEVRREMVVLASLIAGKVVKTSIDTTVQDALVEETLKEMGESTWQR